MSAHRAHRSTRTPLPRRTPDPRSNGRPSRPRTAYVVGAVVAAALAIALLLHAAWGATGLELAAALATIGGGGWLLVHVGAGRRRRQRAELIESGVIVCTVAHSSASALPAGHVVMADFCNYGTVSLYLDDDIAWSADYADIGDVQIVARQAGSPRNEQGAWVSLTTGATTLTMHTDEVTSVQLTGILRELLTDIGRRVSVPARTVAAQDLPVVTRVDALR